MENARYNLFMRSIARLRLMTGLAVGLLAPAALGDDTPDYLQVIDGFYETHAGTRLWGVNLGITGDLDNKESAYGGLALEQGTIRKNDTDRHWGSAMVFVGFALAAPVSPYIEVGANLFDYLGNRSSSGNQTTSNAVQPDRMASAGVRAHLGRHAVLRLYHRWYEAYPDGLQTNFHVWGASVGIRFEPTL